MTWGISILLVFVFGAGVIIGNNFGTNDRIQIEFNFEKFLLYFARTMFFVSFFAFSISLIAYKFYPTIAWYSWVSAWATIGSATITRIWYDFV